MDQDWVDPRIKCTIQDCQRPSTARSHGLCGSHLYRQRKYGDPRHDPPARPAARKRTKGRDLLTGEDIDRLWAEQDGQCAICSTPLHRTGPSSFNADHDHTTGLPRGLLCRACNRGIGLLGDDAARLLKAASYLHRYTRESAEGPEANSCL
jgi:hypothetical protein